MEGGRNTGKHNARRLIRNRKNIFFLLLLYSPLGIRSEWQVLSASQQWAHSEKRCCTLELWGDASTAFKKTPSTKPRVQTNPPQNVPEIKIVIIIITHRLRKPALNSCNKTYSPHLWENTSPHLRQVVLRGCYLHFYAEGNQSGVAALEPWQPLRNNVSTPTVNELRSGCISCMAVSFKHFSLA